MPLHMSCHHTYCLQKTVVTPYLTMPAHIHAHTHILHVLWPAEVSPCYLLCAVCVVPTNGYIGDGVYECVYDV